MSHPTDIERGETEYKERAYDDELEETEREALLPSPSPAVEARSSGGLKSKAPARHCTSSSPRFSLSHLTLAFLGGGVALLVGQFALCGANCFMRSTSGKVTSHSSPYVQGPVGSGALGPSVLVAPPWIGSSVAHKYPPASPTNARPDLFPTDMGYPGPTPTGAEPAVVATAPSVALHSGAPNLLASPSLAKSSKSGFDIFKFWGNLSPWYSIDKGTFGVDSGPEAPDTCRVTALHLLHRHGARYPSGWNPKAYGFPSGFANDLHKSASSWNATGELEFLNDWTYKLGTELLTPFGRQQLYDLGSSMRIKYGFLLQNFTESNSLPVFRTESQNRMLYSALNFAAGFFGIPYEKQYQQSIHIEERGFNTTLVPDKTCPNSADPSKADRGAPYVHQWTNIYLKDAQARLQPQIPGFELDIGGLYSMQMLCAYETVSLGYSKFCELFTEEEWKGFDYSFSLQFWYNHGPGSPLARGHGVGYIQELVARLTETPIETHNSSTNATLNDNPYTFPLGNSLYVDATHEVVVMPILVALNLTGFAASGPLPADHIPPDLSWKVSEVAPFATNVQFQVLSCTSVPDPQIRIIVNDGVAPLTGIKGCPEQKDGMCPLSTFVKAQKETIRTTSWEHVCHGDWSVPPGDEWHTTTGDAPPQ